MSGDFFKWPVINSPDELPHQHWELDADGQPTNVLAATRCKSDLITPVPKPQKRRRGKADGDSQVEMVLGADDGLLTAEQESNPTPIINGIRGYVGAWRQLPNPDQWQVAPETAQLLQHWRHHSFENIRPTSCQVEALEAAIWLAEVAGRIRWRFARASCPPRSAASSAPSRSWGGPRAGHRARVETAAGCIAACDRGGIHEHE